MGPINHRLGAADFLEVHARVVRILEPVEPPETPIAERSRRKVVTMISLPVASIRVAHPSAIELLGTTLREQTNSTARNCKIEVIISKVAACVRDLDYHFLPIDWPGRKSESSPALASDN